MSSEAFAASVAPSRHENPAARLKRRLQVAPRSHNQRSARRMLLRDFVEKPDLDQICVRRRATPLFAISLFSSPRAFLNCKRPPDRL
jgi:hypothetical protein